MTAGTTTQSIDGRRVSLPRTSLGALLGGTLLVGILLGAGVYAGINTAIGEAAAPTAIGAALPREPAAVHDSRIEVGKGPLEGDAPGTPAKATAGHDAASTPAGTTKHAPGRGPLE